MSKTPPTPSAIQRADGIWLPALDGDTMPAMFTTEAAALTAARQRLHAWWHRTDMTAPNDSTMVTCEECLA